VDNFTAPESFKCAKCKSDLGANQVSALQTLWRGGVHSAKGYCSECWPSKKKLVLDKIERLKYGAGKKKSVMVTRD